MHLYIGSYKTMTEQLSRTGKDLNATFLPASLLRKNQNKLATSLASKYQFQKTTGNAFIIIDPPEIKFAGYELERLYTATVRVINRAPVSQRVTFIAPQNSNFSIKTNKKGTIASGMAETLTVLFRSNQFKYQTDVISIRTQTQNFVVPLYAFPTLPDLRAVFPKVIDFGAVQIRQPSTYYYPIKNTVPLNFQFQFSYQKQCQQISINPLKGLIPSQSTLTIQITFLPTAKCTFSAQAILIVHQFDFQPLPITIIGSGLQKSQSQQKRIKSSKLAPLKQAQEGKKTPQPILKRRPSGDVGSNANINNVNLGATGNLNASQAGINLGTSTIKRATIRSNFPKLVSAKRTIVQQQASKTLNPAKLAERQYLNRFSRIQDLDKQKQIKFSQYLGDKALTQSEIQFQLQLTRQIQKVRHQALERKCTGRYNPQLSADIAVEYKNVQQKTVTWDDKQNDQHHNRRKALLRFMNAGTKVILKYRMLKRLGKIKALLAGCDNKQQVRRLVEESHAKAMDQQQGLSLPDDVTFDFGWDSLQPTYFELQYEQNQQKQNSVTYKPQGRANFDDLKEIKQIAPHKVDQFKFAQLQFGPDYFNHSKSIPAPRQSGEEEWFMKTPALPGFQPDTMTSVYSLPIKVPAHHFIYDDQSLRRYKDYVACDEKDPQIYLQNEGPVEDQFQGWTGGQFDILKYKFTRNLGCEYVTFSGFNFSSDRNPLPPLATLGQGLPYNIPEPTFEDTIAEGDSDEEDLQEAPVQPSQKFLDLVQTSADIKQRRTKKEIRNPQAQVRGQIEKSLENLKAKALGDFVGKVKEANKWAEYTQNRFLL